MNRYFPLFTGALLVLFVLSASGITVVLHSCLMEDMKCCTMMRHGAGRATCMSPEDKQVFASPMSSCCRTTIVGGLNTNPALVEKQLTERTEQTTALISVSDPSSAGENQLRPFVFLCSPSTYPVSPPAVGRYLLNQSFLI